MSTEDHITMDRIGDSVTSNKKTFASFQLPLQVSLNALHTHHCFEIILITKLHVVAAFLACAPVQGSWLPYSRPVSQKRFAASQ